MAPVSINLRLPVELHARLKEQAETDMRSLNAEIVWLLDGILTSDSRASDAPQEGS